MKKITSRFAALGVLLFSATYASAQNAPFWGYEGTGTTISTRFAGTTLTMTNTHYQEIGGTNMSDTQLDRWQLLFNSGYLFGSNTDLVRGWDLTEDWDLNWSTPAVYETGSASRWVAIEINGTSSTWVWKNTANAGEFPNQPFLGNPNLIALIDDQALFWDSDDTFSLYHFNGVGYTDYTWTTLSGGLLDGQNLSTSLLQQYFIGGEESQLAFLVGDNAIDFYSLANGNYIRSANYSGVSVGPLASASLADIIDGKVAGWSYVGIDGITPGPVFAGVEPIPEPHTWMLIGCGLGLLIRFGRHRRSLAV